MENDQKNHSKNAEVATDMEPLNDFDQNRFYETDHIDQEHFAEHNRSNEDIGYQEISGTASLADRIADEQELNKEEAHQAKSHDAPTTADGEKLMDVGRAPDS